MWWRPPIVPSRPFSPDSPLSPLIPRGPSNPCRTHQSSIKVADVMQSDMVSHVSFWLFLLLEVLPCLLWVLGVLQRQVLLSGPSALEDLWHLVFLSALSQQRPPAAQIHKPITRDESPANLWYSLAQVMHQVSSPFDLVVQLVPSVRFSPGNLKNFWWQKSFQQAWF